VSLSKLVERLAGASAPPVPPCGCCGTTTGPVAIPGLPDGVPPPGWIGPAGRCLECGRPVRAYRGVDLVLG